MKKPIIALLLGAALVWSCTMAIHNSRAAEAPTVTAPSWYIAAWVVADKDPDVKVVVGKYSTDMKTPNTYPTEAACKEFVKTDKQLKEKVVLANKKAADWKPAGHLVLICTVDNSV